jgi:hypothetical protein
MPCSGGLVGNVDKAILPDNRLAHARVWGNAVVQLVCPVTWMLMWTRQKDEPAAGKANDCSAAYLQASGRHRQSNRASGLRGLLEHRWGGRRHQLAASPPSLPLTSRHASGSATGLMARSRRATARATRARMGPPPSPTPPVTLPSAGHTLSCVPDAGSAPLPPTCGGVGQGSAEQNRDLGKEGGEGNRWFRSTASGSTPRTAGWSPLDADVSCGGSMR